MATTIDSDLWLSNLIDVARKIADREHQEMRWLASDALAWEKPEELINAFLDDCNFELYIEQRGESMTTDQMASSIALRDQLNNFCCNTPEHLDPTVALADPNWNSIRQSAFEFIKAFS